ncbi:hypothetical protein BJV78DRAFT_1156250 [Lactifluus subvellereus]|nr:hypothetical protein BJV78DRAFT_1156250 [Lactifluus subvellereus]
MPKAIPSPLSCGCVDIRAPVLQYPPGYFNIGAAGFRSVLDVVDDLAQAASSVQPSPLLENLTAGTPLSGKHRRPGKMLQVARQKAAPYIVVRRSEGTRAYNNRRGQHSFSIRGAHSCSALCQRTDTKPKPTRTNRSAVRALLEESDKLKPPDTYPTTPLLSLATSASLSDDACSSIKQSPSPSISSTMSTPPPSTPSPPLSRLPTYHTSVEQTGLSPGHNSPPLLVFTHPQVPSDSIEQSAAAGPGCSPESFERSQTGSFPAHVAQQCKRDPLGDVPPRLYRLISASVKRPN